MNKVDILVRNLLNTYPTLYQDRLSALRAFFTSGNYRWDKDGCIVPEYASDRDETVMDFSDLDKDDAENANEKPCEVLSDLYAHRAYEAKRERMLRQLRADNIDTVSKCRVGSGEKISYEQLQHMSFSSSYIGNIYIGGAPFGKIDADWLAAAEEFIDVVKVSYNRIFGLHYDNPLKGEKPAEPSMFSRMPLGFQQRYTELCEISDKLEEQSGTRARMMAYINGDDFKKMMDEIIADENNAV